MMEVKKVLSVGKRLQVILEEAERKSQQELADAKRRSEEMVSKARAEAEEKKSKAQRGAGIDDLIKAEENRAKSEAEKIKAQYEQKIEAIRKIPQRKRDHGVDLVIKEVLP
jgi:V/A-type H+-transporting ATPase subunit G/H